MKTTLQQSLTKHKNNQSQCLLHTRFACDCGTNWFLLAGGKRSAKRFFQQIITLCATDYNFTLPLVCIALIAEPLLVAYLWTGCKAHIESQKLNQSQLIWRHQSPNQPGYSRVWDLCERPHSPRSWCWPLQSVRSSFLLHPRWVCS